MARKKSIQDIIDQYNRITGSIDRSNPRMQQRLQQATNAYNSYMDNIHATRQYQRDLKAWNKVSDRDSVYRLYAMRVNRKYSQRTYMGNAIG